MGLYREYKARVIPLSTCSIPVLDPDPCPHSKYRISRISGSHGGEYEDGCLLGCSALMMEAARTSETLVNFYQTIRRYNPEDSHQSTERLRAKKNTEGLGQSKNN
jgi:hypothetical protein